MDGTVYNEIIRYLGKSSWSEGAARKSLYIKRKWMKWLIIRQFRIHFQIGSNII
jgi:hypothetical protein